MNRRDLIKAIQERMTVRVTTRRPPNDNTHGFPLSFSKEFWLLREVRDFHLDGFRAIPTANIAELRFGKYERAADRILHAEGVAQKAGLNYLVDITTPQALFSSLAATGKFVIIEGTAQEKKARRGESIFVIGPIIRVGKQKVWLHTFDATGRWDRKPTSIDYSDLLLVEFDSEYANIWARHLPARPQVASKMEKRRRP